MKSQYRSIHRFTVFASLVLSLWLFPEGSLAQIRFDLGFELNGIQCGGKILGAPGAKVPFEVFVKLTQENYETGKGASGWALSFRGENIHFLPETVASGANCGTGELVASIPDFFCSAFVVDPDFAPDEGPLAGSPQGEGVVDGMALVIGKSFQGNSTFTLLKVKAEVTIPREGSYEARLYYVDGLQAQGRPVRNGITSVGATVDTDTGRLNLSECRFTVEVEPSEINLVVMAENGSNALVVNAPIGAAGHATAYMVIDSKLNQSEGIEGWQLSLAYSDIINVRSIAPAADLYAAAPGLEGGIGYNETYSSEGDPPLRVDPARIFSASSPPDPDCDLADGLPQGKGILSAVVLALPPNPNKAQYLAPRSTVRVLKIEFEQATPFASEDDPDQIGSFSWKNCLQGPGIQVKNAFTVAGNTYQPLSRRGLQVIFRVQAAAKFIRGDANADARLNIADPIFTISALFRQGPSPTCRDAIDANGDGSIGLADAVYSLNYIFNEGPPPAAPFPYCDLNSVSTAESCPAGSTRCR